MVGRRGFGFVMLVCALAGGGGRLRAEDWVLAAAPFTFTQYYEGLSSAQEGLATLLPQLVLEQAVAGSARMTTDMEALDRALEDLQTARISLFLQLSKEIRARDALVLTEGSRRKRRKKLAAAEKAIRDIAGQIDDNLADAERARAEFRERELHRVESQRRALPEFIRRPFSAFFTRGEGAVLGRPGREPVALYRDDPAVLFTPSQSAQDAGLESRAYEKEVLAAQVRGLVTGRITVYGDYVSVTAELRIFPGNRVAGTITEVGTLDASTRIADGIARYLLPVVANSRPVRLYFDVSPAGAAAGARVTVDGAVVQLEDWSVLLPAGMHTVEVSSPGYEAQVVTHDFQNVPSFWVGVPLERESSGSFVLGVRNPEEGELYADGRYVGGTGPGAVSAQVTINGEPVIGQFLSRRYAEDGGQLGSFYYIPERLQSDGAELMVTVNPVDTSALIDRRRIWMYRGYSALVLSLPFTIFCWGKFNSAYVGFYRGFVTLDEARTWDTLRWVSAGISIAAGSFFVFELVRYLRAASTVLPAQARAARPGEMEQAVERSRAGQAADADGMPEAPADEGPRGADGVLAEGE